METTYVDDDVIESVPDEKDESFYEEIRKVTTYLKHYPGRNMTEISRAMKWSIGKTQKILNYTEKTIGSICSTYKVINGRNHRNFFIVPWYNRMDWVNILEDEALPELVAQIAQLQTEAYRNGYAIIIKDSILQGLLEEYIKKTQKSSKND